MKKRLSFLLTFIMLLTMVMQVGVSAQSTYTVKEGDVLWRIARQYDMDWEDLAKYNNLANPHLIYVGQQIKIPTAGEEDVAEVKSNEVQISLLATSDLHGRIYPYEYAIDSADADAGLAKIQTLVKAERAASDNVILMDLGDTVQDNSAELFNADPVHPMIKALNYMDYDTWTIGNHEFNFEKSFLDNNVNTFNGSVLGANIYKTDGSYYVKPYTIIEKEGVRVAIVGLLPPHIDTWEAAAPQHFEGLAFEGTVESAKKTVAAIAGQYDILVGAFHLGKDGEHGYEGASAVAEAVPEFDVIFMGHAHEKLADLKVNGVTMIEPGAYGAALSKADIVVTKTADKFAVTSITPSNIETSGVEADADMLAEFKYVHDASLADANTVVGSISADYIENVDYITGEANVTTMPTSQVEDTALIDLINEVQLFYTEADVSSAATFTNNMNLVAGEFKKKDVAYIYKYPNTLMGVNITGANLKKYMEWSASYYNTYVPGDVTVSFDPNIRGYNYDMFAGVTYDIDISQPSGSRITNLLMNGVAIDDAKTYKLAVNNYRFGTLLGLELVTEADKYYDSYNEMQDAGRIRDLIIKYIVDEKAGVATPSLDNNWKIIGNEFEHPLKAEALEMVKSGAIEIPTSEDGRTPNVKSVNVYDLIKDGKFTEYQSLTLLHTNDMHGFFVEGQYDGMGAAKLKTVFDMYKGMSANTLILDAGDATQGANLVTLSKGEKAIEVLNALGYDAMTTGNHEFDYDQAQLLKNVSMADFPVLAANVKKADGTDFLTPYVIKDVNGIKVAIFGLITPDTTFLSHPDNSVGLTFEDPAAVAATLVPSLRAQADVVVALVHLGDEGGVYTSSNLATNVTGIDVIIDGHSHSTYPNGNVVNGTLIASAGEKTKNVGIIEFALKDGAVISNGARLFTKAMSLNIEGEPTVAALIETIKAENAVIENEVVATTPEVLLGERDDVRTGETNLGNLIAESLLDISGADVALTNGGGIRTSINAGDITKGEVLTVLPFGNTVRVIELTGADLVAAIENGITDYPEAKGAFPHIAGMMVEFDSSKDAGSRVTSLKIAGEEVDTTATYTLATNDYLVAGGDGYTMFTGKKVVAEFGAMDEVLIDFINASGTGKGAITDRIKDIAELTSAFFYELFDIAA
ncbi:MAG: 5'-nucleotidase C-terminal domain-containing protein [Vallitaleaceae bacterium]|nr:5'-nucleotidase C-terminal domain-containing protein [Vallitaleaceae bacterium]